MSSLRLAVRQVRYENKAFWRNPASAFFTFAFPLIFLFVFTTLLDGSTELRPGQRVDLSTYYTASILAFAVITACYTNIAIAMTFLRDQGVLKRVRGTPLPSAAYLLGRILHAVLVMALLVVIVCAFGRIVYDVDLPTTSAPAFLVTLLVGAFTFCALGLACTALIPNADAAPAIVNGTVLPLLFLSGVFIPTDDAPGWVKAFAAIFPVRPFLRAIVDSFIPSAANPSGWHWSALVVVVAWGVGGLVVASRTFRWD